MNEIKPIQPSPTDLLARAVQQLAALNQRTADLLAQQEQAAKERAELTAAVKALNGVRYTKVIDLNMPFWNLAGFLVKVALASIPAYIVLGALALLVTALLGTSCTALSLLGQ